MKFAKKPKRVKCWISGGFFAIHRKVIDHIWDETVMLEHATFEQFAKDHEPMAFKMKSFDGAMHTFRDKQFLNSLWASGPAPFA